MSNSRNCNPRATKSAQIRVTFPSPGYDKNTQVKLTIVTETFPPEINGVAMTFGHIARELGRRGHQVTVCHPRRDDLGKGKVHSDFQTLPLPGLPIPGYPLLRFGLPAFITNPDRMEKRLRSDP